MVEAVKREKTIKIRVSAEEFETLKSLSTRQELARWMRETCLSDGKGKAVKPSKRAAVADPALLRQLAGIGNNLNQMARKVNTGDWAALDRVAVIAGLSSIEKALNELRQANM